MRSRLHVLSPLYALPVVFAVAACATQIKSKPESELINFGTSPNGITIVGTMATEESERFESAFQYSGDFTRGDDHVAVKVYLNLPEIRIPQYRKHGIEPDPRPSAFNGNVCLQASLRSSIGFDESKRQWKSTLEIDGAKVQIDFAVRPQFIFDIRTGKSAPIPGGYDLWVCTKKKFPKVKTVVWFLSESGYEAVRASWSAPWPALPKR